MRRSLAVLVLALGIPVLAIAVAIAGYLGLTFFVRPTLVEPDPRAASNPVVTVGPAVRITPIPLLPTATLGPGVVLLPTPTRSRVVSPSPTTAPARVVAEGELTATAALRQASGRALILRLPNGDLVLRFEQIAVTGGPDLQVYLATDPAPSAASALAAAVSLGPLRAAEGSFNYRLALPADLTTYRSVVIYDGLLQTIVAVAPLRP